MIMSIEAHPLREQTTDLIMPRRCSHHAHHVAKTVWTAGLETLWKALVVAAQCLTFSHVYHM